MDGLLQRLREFGPTRLAAMGGVAVAVLGLIGFLALSGGGGPMEPLFQRIDPSDQQEILTILDSRGVNSQVEGDTILVPSNEIPALRIELARLGLPSNSGAVGNELFDADTPLGMTEAEQRIRRQRALEGELERTIKALETIRAARVHLVLPEREIFSRQRREARSSVLVQTTNRQKLNPQEVSSIEQIIAAAVPGLRAENISIADEAGNLYRRGNEDEETALASRAEEQRLNEEARLTRQIETLVGRTVGPANVRAEVNAELDFNRESINEEIYAPDAAVPRSTQVVEEEAESTETQGEDPVTVAQNLPDANTAITTGAGSFQRSTRVEETTNFEVSRQFKTSIRETAQVKRLSVAVLVNHKEVDRIGPEGEVMRAADGTRLKDYVERTDAEMAEIRNLVLGAIGFNPDREDNIQIVNLPFFETQLDDPIVDTILGMPKEDLFRILEFLVLGVVVVLVILLVVRPLIARALDQDEEEEGAIGLPDRPGQALLAGDLAGVLDESAEMEALEQMIDINQVEGRVRASSLRKIGEIVDKHPEEAVAILRNWIYQEA
ncbi:MAG: flagellar basal-body MS-ring/collar protein FliF [Pseudomonadota bacterium]